MAFKSILILAFVFISTKGNSLFDPCNKDDLECLKTATDSFMSKTYAGAPEYNMLKVDPLIVPHLDVIADDELGLVFHFHNITFNGYKALKTTDFKMNTELKSVLLKTQTDLSYLADVTVELTKSKKTFEGLYSASATVLQTANYGYSIIAVNGTDYFNVGPETIECEVVGFPTVNIGEALQNELDSDPDSLALKPEWETKKTDIRKKTTCKLANAAFVSVMHNLRASAKLFPVTNFFIGL